jgi:hypothetical protein
VTGAAASTSQWTGEFYYGDRFFLDEEGASLLVVGARARIASLPTGPALLTPNPLLSFLQVSATWAVSISESDTLIFSFRPGVFGAPDAMALGAFRPEGFFLWDRVFSERLTIGLGGGRGSGFGRVLFAPLLHVLFTHESWLVDVLAPVRLDVWWLPNPNWEFGVTASLNGSQYSVVNVAAGYDTVRLAGAYVGPAARLKVLEKGYVSLETGIDFLRKFDALMGETLVLEAAPAAQAFARIGFQLRY